jgi:hypothetical protein
MSERLVTFNTLPPRAEHLAAVKAVLQKRQSLSLGALLSETGLTKTQALCALDLFILQGAVHRSKGKFLFNWVQRSDAGEGTV